MVWLRETMGAMMLSMPDHLILEPLAIHPERPLDALPALEDALRGKRSLLPVPATDRNRADLLRTTLRAGQRIEGDVALVMATSGSTGTPKGALLSPANLQSSAEATATVIGSGTWVLAMPAHYIAGIQVLVRSVIAGTTPRVLPVDRGFDIPAFAHCVKGAGPGPLYTSLTPMQLMKAMDTLEGIEALRAFSAVLVGGAALSPRARRAASELRIRVVETYGASETAGGCVYNGRPLPGVEVRVADTDNRVSLGGPMIARGYRTPRPELDGTWFHTSDAGALDADGKLEILGRLDTVIDSGGLKLHPEVLEKALLTVPGVSAACVVGVPDERLGQAIGAMYVGTAAAAEVYEHLIDEQGLPRWQLPRVLRRVGKDAPSNAGSARPTATTGGLPLLPSGKVDRQAVARMLQQ